MSGKKYSKWQYKTDKMTRVTESATKIITASVWSIACVAIFYFIYRSIEKLAGKDTFADINVDWSVVTKAEVIAEIIKKSVGCGDLNPFLYWSILAMSLLILIGSLFYGAGQRKLRKDNISRLEGHIKFLESKIDPQRSTSSLRNDGETNPRDE